MIKADIVARVVNRIGLSKTRAEMAVETVFEVRYLVRNKFLRSLSSADRPRQEHEMIQVRAREAERTIVLHSQELAFAQFRSAFRTRRIALDPEDDNFPVLEPPGARWRSLERRTHVELRREREANC